MGTKAIFSRSPGGRARSQPARQRKRSAAERARLLELYGRSGLSQRRFCERHELALSTLTYWLRQARRRGTSTVAPAIVELPSGVGGEMTVGAAPSDARETVSIRLPSGLEVRAGSGAEVRSVGTLLRELHACFG